MKAFIAYRAKITASLLALSAAAILMSQAKAEEKSDESRPARRQLNRPEGARGFPGAIGPVAAGFERIYNILTEEQRTSLREAMQSQREKMRESEEKLRDARKEIFEAALADKFDENAVRQKAAVVAKVEADMLVLRAKAFSEMRPALSSEQLQKLKNSDPSTTGTQTDRPRRRPEVPRDENGLPPKDRVPAEPKSK